MSRGGCRHLVAFEEEGDEGEGEDEGEGDGDGDEKERPAKKKGEDWFTLNRCEVRWVGEGGEGDDDGDAPDLSFLPVAPPTVSARRGMGGMAAMFARSAAAPAPLGRLFKPSRGGNGDAGEDAEEGKNDDDDEDEDEDAAGGAVVVAADPADPAEGAAPNASANVAAAAVQIPPSAAGGGGPSEALPDDPEALDGKTEKPETLQMIAPLPENGLVGVLPDDLPSVVTVVCKQTAGDYHPRTGLITCLCLRCADAKDGNEDASVFTMDPNRWEMHCGMGQAKKWKASVRVLLENHRTMPVGKWLTGFGVAVSAPRAPRRDARFGPKRNKLKKMKKNGLLDDEEAMYRRLEPMGRRTYGDGTRSGDTAVEPPKVSGKRLFVELVPYVVRGAKLRSRGGNNRGGFARRGFGGDERDELSGMDGENGVPAVCDPAVAEGASLPIESRVFTPEAWEADRAAALARRTTGAVAAAAMEAASRGGAAMIDEGVGVRERIAEAQRLLRDRVTFGKSNIHGWGLIAKTHIKAGTMVVPFRGESVRPSVANLREKAYEASGRDCYLLMADPKTVIDTTAKGNVARFTNHSCNPNMYTKIVSADGASHIIFFTRADVKPGEELTYNYRFDAEEGRVPCYCGAYNCRGFLC
jgi:NuA3 HAT complex component NTO1